LNLCRDKKASKESKNSGRPLSGIRRGNIIIRSIPDFRLRAIHNQLRLLKNDSLVVKILIFGKSPFGESVEYPMVSALDLKDASIMSFRIL